MGMSSSQPQPVTQGTMGSPTKSYGPVGGMLNSAQNQVNPQTPQILTQTVPNPTAPQQPGNSSLQPNVQWGTHSQVPTGQGMGPQMNYMGNHGFMPMGNAGFMPMGNHNFMPMGFGQMPTFGGPRGGKAPQGGGNPPQAMGGDPYVMGANPNTGRQVRAGYQGGPQTVAYQKQATDNYDGFYSVPYAYDPSIAKSDYGKIGAGNLGASAGFL